MLERRFVGSDLMYLTACEPWYTSMSISHFA